jgi:hypothetical protein
LALGVLPRTARQAPPPTAMETTRHTNCVVFIVPPANWYDPQAILTRISAKVSADDPPKAKPARLSDSLLYVSRGHELRSKLDHARIVVPFRLACANAYWGRVPRTARPSARFRSRQRALARSQSADVHRPRAWRDICAHRRRGLPGSAVRLRAPYAVPCRRRQIAVLCRGARCRARCAREPAAGLGFCTHIHAHKQSHFLPIPLSKTPGQAFAVLGGPIGRRVRWPDWQWSTR